MQARKAAATIPAGLLHRWKERIGVSKTEELAELFRQRPLLTVRSVGSDPGTLESAGLSRCEKWPWDGRFAFFSAGVSDNPNLGKILEGLFKPAENKNFFTDFIDKNKKLFQFHGKGPSV